MKIGTERQFVPGLLTIVSLAALLPIVCSVPSGYATQVVTPRSPIPDRYQSPVPRQVFSGTLAEQEKELSTNDLMLRFAASRKKLAADRFRPVYHFVSPES